MRRLMLLVVLVFFGALTVSAQVDGAKLAFISRTDIDNIHAATVQVYDFDTQSLTDIGGMQFDYAYGLTWSVDGRLAFGAAKDQDHAVYVWDGSELQTIANGIGYGDFTWSD